jgi:uncharacterized protein DUF4198
MSSARRPGLIGPGHLALLAAILLHAVALQAHDFWIEPATFHPAPGATVAITLRVGQNAAGETVPRWSGGIAQFFVRQGGRDEQINGLERIDPAGWLRADGQATAVIAYRSRASYIEMAPAAFEDYLRQEGLDRIIVSRTALGERAKKGREYFSRDAKALLTGARTSPAVTQPVGLEYEIVPDEDPTLQAGALRGHVLYNGAPLQGALVVAILRSDPSVHLAARTGERGSFAFALPCAGVWLVKSVHMVRAWFFSAADWDSLWASLTFESPQAPRLRESNSHSNGGR